MTEHRRPHRTGTAGVRLAPDELAILKAAAAERGVTVSDLIDAALRQVGLLPPRPPKCGEPPAGQTALPIQAPRAEQGAEQPGGTGPSGVDFPSPQG